jgi:sugar-specific transcriptional regulator TrmB
LGLPQEDIRTLIELGLTRLQAKVYLALIQYGTMKTKKLAELSEVARPDVYRTLSKLKNMGLVEQEIVKPVRFKAIQTDIALNILLENKKRNYDQLKIKVANLRSKYKKQNNISFTEESKFVFVPSKEALIHKLRKAIAISENSIDVATSCKRLVTACYCLSEALQEAWDNGVKGRAIINFNTEENKLEIIKKSWRAPNAKIRYINAVPGTIMAKYDNKEVFIFTNPESSLKDSPALWSNNPSVIAMAKDYFEILWTTAMETPDYKIDQEQF